MARSSGRPKYRVGDQVRLQFGLEYVIGTIVEDRGKLGVGGRRLYGVRFKYDLDNTIYTEVPEEDLTSATTQESSPS